MCFSLCKYVFAQSVNIISIDLKLLPLMHVIWKVQEDDEGFRLSGTHTNLWSMVMISIYWKKHIFCLYEKIIKY